MSYYNLSLGAANLAARKPLPSRSAFSISFLILYCSRMSSRLFFSSSFFFRLSSFFCSSSSLRFAASSSRLKNIFQSINLVQSVNQSMTQVASNLKEFVQLFFSTDKSSYQPILTGAHGNQKFGTLGRLKGQCHEMDISFGGLNIVIRAFCVSADEFQDCSKACRCPIQLLTYYLLL